MQRIKFLDGLRGWGAFFVVLYHVFSSGFPASDFAQQYLCRFLPFNGPFAVFIFFTVSGFALTISHLNEPDERQLGVLAATRYFRLALPIFCACAVVHVAQLTGVLQPPSERLPPWGSFVAFSPSTLHLLRFSFFDVFFNYNFAITYIGPLWTMSIELFGSFVAIGIVLVVGRLKFRQPILIVICAALFLYGSMNFLFVFGVALADLYQRRGLDGVYPIGGLILIAISTLYLAVLPWSGGRFDMLAACVFIIGSIVQPSIRRLLSGTLSKQLGMISFPLYLMHGPVMLILGAPMMQHFGTDLRSKTLIQFVVVAVSLVAAYAFLPINKGVLKWLRWIGQSASCTTTPSLKSI